MGTLNTCVVCVRPVDRGLVREEFADMLTQVDCHGVESLTEKEQVVYEYMCCSRECFDNLE
ncbi:MAG: hypothetical protein JRE23_17080 [Deltaproteobacteria bacterium]|nr:hypothetical protein [Deltaproteobacteria bacterium]